MQEDTRPHRSLVRNEDVEWITDLAPKQVSILNGLLNDANEFGDLDLLHYCQRFMRMRPAIHGKRAQMLADVARYEEEQAKEREENRVPGEPRSKQGKNHGRVEREERL